MAQFYQFSPIQMYLKVLPESAETKIDKSSVIKTDACCPELLLLFAKNLYKYGNPTLDFHAHKLGIDTFELRYSIKALTGMSFTNFTDEFQFLRVNDVMDKNPEWGSIKDKAKELGFSNSGLYRFMKRKMHRTPSGGSWS